MSEEAKADEELQYATRFVKLILLTIGAWPISITSSLFSKLLRRLKHVITYFLYFVALVPSALYTYMNVRGRERAYTMGAIINCSVQLCKYTILLHRMKEIQIGLNAIRQNLIDTTDEGRLIFREKAKIARRLVLMAAIIIYGSGLSFRAIIPRMKAPVIGPDNTTIRQLPCPARFLFFDAQITPYFEIVYTLQVFGGFVSYTSLSGTCGVCALLVLHTCGMLRILQNKLIDLVDNTYTNEAVLQQRIKEVVEYQVKIKRFLNNTQRITEYICLTEVLGSTTLLCFVGYSALVVGAVLIELLHIPFRKYRMNVFQEFDARHKTTAISLIMVEISFMFCLFILCYIGQLLVDENNVLSWTCCTINWYRLPNKQARYLVLVIATSNSPMKLTAGKITEMSLATFTDIMKVSMGYLNILREVV